MYTIRYTGQFKKEMQLCEKRGYDMSLLHAAIKLLMEQGKLPQQYQPHKLVGNRRGQWECHIQPNWLLVWEQHDDELILIMLNTGTHSDLFYKKRR